MRLLVLALILPLAACALPAEGPGTSEIVSAAEQVTPPYAVVALDASIADTIAAHEYESFASFGEGGGAPDIRIGVGDTVIVTIYEAASGGLFTGEAGSLGAASKSVSLPPQPVARNGMISVPYVGQLKAAGLTPAEVQQKIEAGLRDKAIEPQVIVTVTSSSSTFVTVMGEVGSPSRVPLNLDGDRVLDVLAVSGGTDAPDYDTYVRLTRGSRTRSVSLSRIVEDPGQNIFVRPDDQMNISTDPRRFIAFGATGRNEVFPFQTDRLTLAEAVGRTGGLNDDRADPRGVFVFRYERPDVYALVRGDDTPPSIQAGGVPVVYKLDFKDPSGFFAAQRFVMRDNDVIFVSNSAIVSVEKFFGIIGRGVGVARSSTSLAIAVD